MVVVMVLVLLFVKDGISMVIVALARVWKRVPWTWGIWVTVLLADRPAPVLQQVHLVFVVYVDLHQAHYHLETNESFVTRSHEILAVPILRPRLDPTWYNSHVLVTRLEQHGVWSWQIPTNPFPTIAAAAAAVVVVVVSFSFEAGTTRVQKPFPTSAPKTMEPTLLPPRHDCHDCHYCHDTC